MKLSNKPVDVDEDGIPILREDQIVLDDDSDDLVVKVPKVVYSASSIEVKSPPKPTEELAPVKVISRSEQLFNSILNSGERSMPCMKAAVPQLPCFIGSSYGSSGESIREASNENESRDSVQFNLFDEDEMMEEFLGKQRIDDILATIDL